MMEDLFKAILGGIHSQPGSGQVESDPLTDLLGSVLGGGVSQSYGHTPSAGLTQSHSSIPSAGGFAGIVNGILGGGNPNSITNSLAAPIANALAKKLNLSPEIAQIVVTFVMGKLLSNAVGGPGASYAQSGRSAPSPVSALQGELGLGDLLNNMDGGQGFNTDYLQSTGMVEALSRRTGLDHDAATQSMQAVFAMLGAQSGSR